MGIFKSNNAEIAIICLFIIQQIFILNYINVSVLKHMSNRQGPFTQEADIVINFYY